MEYDMAFYAERYISEESRAARDELANLARQLPDMTPDERSAAWSRVRELLAARYSRPSDADLDELEGAAARPRAGREEVAIAPTGGGAAAPAPGGGGGYVELAPQQGRSGGPAAAS